MLIALTMLRLSEDSIIRQVFTIRVRNFKENTDMISEKVHKSPTCEIMKAATRLCILNTLCDMTIGKRPLYTKRDGPVMFGNVRGC